MQCSFGASYRLSNNKIDLLGAQALGEGFKSLHDRRISINLEILRYKVIYSCCNDGIGRVYEHHNPLFHCRLSYTGLGDDGIRKLECGLKYCVKLKELQ